MSYLRNIRVFVRVYELGSLSAAARDLRLSPAVVSNRVKELEAHLGVRLFNRTTRRLSPTELGRRFFPGASKILEAVAEAEAAVIDLTHGVGGAVRIAAPLGPGRRMIAPLAAELHDLYPKVELQLRLTDRHLDLTAEGLDAAFVLGRIENSSLKLRAIADCAQILCATPAYLARKGAPSDIGDLIKNHDCLLPRHSGVTVLTWTLNTPEGPREVQVSGPFDADDGDVLLDWALAGRGIVNRPVFEVASDLASGRLVPVLPQHPPPSVRFACVYPHKRLQDPKVRLVIDFVIAKCRKRIAEMLAPLGHASEALRLDAENTKRVDQSSRIK